MWLKKLKKVFLANGMTNLVGYTVTSVSGKYIYFTDAEGDQVKIAFDTTTPIIIDTNTTSITISPSATTMNVNTTLTQTLTIYNQNSDNVTFESTFVPSSPSLMTGGTYGNVITFNTGATTGTTLVNVYHSDSVSATTTFTVQNVPTALVITISGQTSGLTGGTHVSGTTLNYVIKNQAGLDVTAYCTVDTSVYITTKTKGSFTLASTHVSPINFDVYITHDLFPAIFGTYHVLFA